MQNLAFHKTRVATSSISVSV